MKVEKPDWLKLKELHDAEEQTIIHDGRIELKRPRSRGCMYGPSQSNVDQVGDGIVDINRLMSRYDKTGDLEQLIQAGATFNGEGIYLTPEADGITPTPYGDFETRRVFEHAHGVIEKARDQFQKLDAKIRNRFENDPRKFLDFVNDPANAEELLFMGLRKRPEPPKEPDVTLKDVRDEIRAANAAQKPAGKGGKGGE